MKKIAICGIVLGSLGFIVGACGRGTVVSDDGHGHDEHGHGEDIELSEKQMQTVGIELGTLSRSSIGSGLRVNGSLEVDPQAVAEVSPLLSGSIVKINVREGSAVKAGEVLATIRNLDVVGYARDYREALQELEYAGAELERQEALAAEGAGVRKNLERARADCRLAQTRVSALERQLQMAGISSSSDEGAISGVAVVRAPISGVVSKISCATGGYADPSLPMMTIVDNSKVYALMRIFEKDIPAVSRGEQVELSLTNGDGHFLGVVDEVNPVIDSETKAINMRVRITDASGLTLLPGMAVSGVVQTDVAEADVLPEESVVSTGGKDYVYVLESEEVEDGERMYRFEAVEVVAGRRRLGMVEVTPVGNLEPQARIVVKGAFYLASMATDHGEHDH